MGIPSVLIIDDDESVNDIIEHALRVIDVSCQFAVTADNGLVMVKENLPQLILMDLLLPFGMKGWEAIQVLKTDVTTQHIPIIALTAATGQYIQQAMRAGAVEFIIKPFTIPSLQRTVKQYITAARC